MGPIEELVEHLVPERRFGEHCLYDEACPTCARLLPLIQAELAARGPERVVRIEPISEFGPHTRYRLVNCGPEGGVSLEFWEAERLFGTSQPGEYTIRRLDAPKPVAVWERPKGPRALSPYLCSICSCLLSPRDLDKRCRGCKSPLASTPSPWPGTTDQLAAQVRQGG